MQNLLYLIANQQTQNEQDLLSDLWRSIKTRTYFDKNQSKEGVTFHNMVMFILVINKVYPEKFMKTLSPSRLDESRPFGQISEDGNFFV